jgi:hypothetical protein
MSLLPELHEAAVQTAAILDTMGCPYAIGGAVAMGFSGYLRGTNDLDVLVLVPAVRTQEFADRLNAAGFRMRDESGALIEVDSLEMIRSGREVGHFRVWWNGTKVEVFSPKVPLQDSILKRRTKVQVEGHSLWITTAEDLILLKMIFYRPKDIEDVRRLIAANRDTLDKTYLEGWIGRTLEDKPAGELRRMLQELAV